MKNRKNRSISITTLTKPWIRIADGRLRFRWIPLSLWVGAFGITSWLAVTSALYFHIKYSSGYTEVRFSHIVGLPFTLKNYRLAKGNFFLREGLDAANNNRWREAFDLLQLGLLTNPEHEEARLILARIYLMARRPDQAKAIFLDGLEFRTDKQADYIRTVLSFLFEQQADSTVVDIANTLLSRSDLEESLRNTLLIARLYAAFNQDRFDEAKRSLTGTNLEISPQAKFIGVRIDWERGLRESALIALRELYTRFPQDDEIYRVLQIYLREQGLQDEARRMALRHQLAFPTKPEPYLDFIRLCVDKTMESRRATAIEDYLRLFGQEPSLLLRLQTVAAQSGWSDLARRIVSLIPNEQIAEKNAAHALAIEADLIGKAYQKAARHAAEQLLQGSELTAQERTILVGLEGVAYFGQGIETEGISRIERVLSSEMASSSMLASLGRYLQSMGRIETAERLFARAVEVDELNTAALVSLLQIKLEIRKLDESLDLIERLPLVRKPSRQLMQDIINTLESDCYIYVAERKHPIESLEKRIRLIDQR